MLMGLTASAQTNVTFDTEDYASLGVYDTWEQSPFRTNKLQGNVQVIDNHLTDVDPNLGLAPNASAKILGLQRSRFGSNTFGARINLKESFRLTKNVRYVHVMVYKTVESKMLLCGLGNRTEEAWSWQTGECEQFKVASNKVPAGKWVDVVFPINGFSYADTSKGGIEIKSLVVCPDLRTPQEDAEDFICYIDEILVNDDAAPRFISEKYALSFDDNTRVTRSDRHLDAVGIDNKIVDGMGSTIYNNATARAIFPVKAAQSVTPKFQYTGNWMGGYVYVDWNNDGRFDYKINDNGTPAEGSEIVSYSAYNPKQATGEGADSWLKSDGQAAGDGNRIKSEFPTFTIPAGTAPGFYRIRYKVDWNSIDPAGNATSGNKIVNNGGGVTDAILDVHTDQIQVTEGSLNGQMLTADGQPMDNIKAPYGQPYTVKIDPYPGFSHNGVIIRSGYNTGENEQMDDNENPRYIVNSFPYEAFDENGLLTIPAEMMIGGEVLVEGQFIEELKTPYTVTIQGAENGAVTYRGKTYRNGDELKSDHVLEASWLTGVPVEGFNNIVITIEGSNIKVKYTNEGQKITALSQLRNDMAYFIKSISGEGNLVYNPDVTTDYVSIKASNGAIQGYPGDATVANQYKSDVDASNPNDSWQILQKNGNYYLYNPGAKKFVTLDNRDYKFTTVETPLKELRANAASETASISGTNKSLEESFSILGANGSAQHYACICTNTTPQAVRNWTYNDHGAPMYIIENPNLDVVDIFASPTAISINDGTKVNSIVYDITGRRVYGIPAKGAFIRNGKIMIVK